MADLSLAMERRARSGVNVLTGLEQVTNVRRQRLDMVLEGCGMTAGERDPVVSA